MWTPWERRWRDAVLDAALPGHRAEALSPDAWADWSTHAPPLLRTGLRAAVWALTWGAVLTHGRPLHRLDGDARDAAIARWADRDGFLARQLVLVVKVVGGLAADRARREPR